MENMIEMTAQRVNALEEISRLDFASARGPFVVSQEHIARPVVLIVEPDPHSRVAALELPQMEDYRVLTAGSLTEALVCAVQNPGVDLPVTEERISSEESGEQVIQSLRATLGDRLKALLITDGTLSTRTRQDDPRVRVVAKPVSADELLQGLGQLRESSYR